MPYTFKIKFEGKTQSLDFPTEPSLDDKVTVQNLKKHVEEIFDLEDCKLLKFKHENEKLLKDCKLRKTTRITVVGSKRKDFATFKKTMKDSKHLEMAWGVAKKRTFENKRCGIIQSLHKEGSLNMEVRGDNLLNADLDSFLSGNQRDNIVTSNKEMSSVTIEFKGVVVCPSRYEITMSPHFPMKDWIVDASQDGVHWHKISVERRKISSSTTRPVGCSFESHPHFYNRFKITQTTSNQRYDDSLFTVNFTKRNIGFNFGTSFAANPSVNANAHLCVTAILDQSLMAKGIRVGMPIVQIEWTQFNPPTHQKHECVDYNAARFHSLVYTRVDGAGSPFAEKTITFQKIIPEDDMRQNVLCFDHFELWGEVLMTDNYIDYTSILATFLQSIFQSLGNEYNECMWSLGDECNYQSSIDVNFSSICEKMLKWIYCTFGESAEEVLNNHDFGSLYSACVEKYRTMIFPDIRCLVGPCLYEWEKKWEDLQWPKSCYELVAEFLEYFPLKVGTYRFRPKTVNGFPPAMKLLRYDGAIVSFAPDPPRDVLEAGKIPQPESRFLSVCVPILYGEESMLAFFPNSQRANYSAVGSMHLYHSGYRPEQLGYHRKNQVGRQDIAIINDNFSAKILKAYPVDPACPGYEREFRATLELLSGDTPQIFFPFKIGDRVKIVNVNFIEKEKTSLTLSRFRMPKPNKVPSEGKITGCIVHEFYHTLLYKVDLDGFDEMQIDCRGLALVRKEKERLREIQIRRPSKKQAVEAAEDDVNFL